MEAFIGSIMLFAGNFAPRGWALCQGQLLPIAQNTALFSILGTTYGGNGQTTFALPDLRGRAAIGQGPGPGLQPVVLGEMSGTPTTTLTVNNMPAHNHALMAGGGADQFTPDGHLMGTESNQQTQVYAAGNPTGQMNPQSIGAAGGSQPFSIMQPYLGLNYIICMEGIYPSRN